MKTAAIVFQLIMLVSFPIYGISCLFANKMADEFRRYQLEHFRVLIGVLEIAGGIGLAAGFYFPWLTLLASLGLSILMVMGALVRVRLRDSFRQMAPAIFFFGISFFVFVSELQLIL